MQWCQWVLMKFSEKARDPNSDSRTFQWKGMISGISSKNHWLFCKLMYSADSVTASPGQLLSIYVWRKLLYTDVCSDANGFWPNFLKKCAIRIMTHNLSYHTHETSDQSWDWHTFFLDFVNSMNVYQNKCIFGNFWQNFHNFQSPKIFRNFRPNFQILFPKIFGKLASLCMGQLLCIDECNCLCTMVYRASVHLCMGQLLYIEVYNWLQTVMHREVPVHLCIYTFVYILC